MACFGHALKNLGHKNILKFCSNRKFKDIEEHDEAYIANHNALVAPEDDVWCLGDFAFRNEKPVDEYVKALNGRIHILFGNHDKSAIMARNVFTSSHFGIFELVYKKKKFVLCHYPMIFFNSSSHKEGAFHFHGHIHTHPVLRPYNHIGFHPNSYDVGVDNNDHSPILIEDAIDKILKNRDEKWDKKEKGYFI